MLRKVNEKVDLLVSNDLQSLLVGNNDGLNSVLAAELSAVLSAPSLISISLQHAQLLHKFVRHVGDHHSLSRGPLEVCGQHRLEECVVMGLSKASHFSSGCHLHSQSWISTEQSLP